ncbi:hypothetical protein C5F53_19895 [Rhodoferax sp. TS-BS-61-7]|nr:hypothetical protein C5F53_19895 [Rhodoferax sp. TS-BS-61-7]
MLKNVTNNLASSAMDAALNGKSFDEKPFANSLKGALISTGNAQGAFAIGSADLDAFTNKLAHAALGCAGGVAMGGSCNAGSTPNNAGYPTSMPPCAPATSTPRVVCSVATR